MSSRKKLLVGVTGSVATIKLPELINLFLKENVEIQIIVTEHSKKFFNLSDIPNNVKINQDEDEWTQWNGRGDPILHIDLTKWADCFLISPLDACTLGKIANGICDNLLTCTARAWNIDKPLIFCPAMNTYMWNHPITSSQVLLLKQWGYIEIPCIEKTLMCGDKGLGAMAEIKQIKETVLNYIF